MQSVLVESTFNNACKCWNGNEFLGNVNTAGMTEEYVNMHMVLSLFILFILYIIQ